MGSEIELDVEVPLEEVVAKLRAAFRHVDVDEAEGKRRALALAQWIEDASPNIFLGRHEEAVAHARRLKLLGPHEVAVVEFGDTPEKSLRFLCCPGEIIRFGYSSAAEERDKRELVKRFAATFGASIAKF